MTIIYFTKKGYSKSLRNEIKEILHEPYLESVKTKTRARESLLWPGMNEEIEIYISNYSVCVKNMLEPILRRPLINDEFPDLPFEKGAVHILEFQNLPTLILVDYYSYLIDIEKNLEKPLISVLVCSLSNSCLSYPVFREFSKVYHFEVRTVKDFNISRQLRTKVPI